MKKIFLGIAFIFFALTACVLWDNTHKKKDVHWFSETRLATGQVIKFIGACVAGTAKK